MNFLPAEVQLDIFKYLDSDQLLSFQQTNLYFKSFINKYKEELARKKFCFIEIRYINENYLNDYIFFRPEPKLYDFQLSKKLERKWKYAIEESIPTFLSTTEAQLTIAALVVEPKYKFYLQFPKFPKNIEEMKIVRYLLEKLFKCTIESAHFNFIIFNPKMIQLLFEENKTNIPLQIHSRRTFLFNNNKQTKYLLKFVLNHLISNEFNVWPSNRQNLDVAFKILTTGGDKFPKVCCEDTIYKSSVYNFIIRHIETSKDCSKIVKEISLRIRRPLILSERAENIEIKIEKNNRVKSTKYQLSNKYNPEIMFSVYIRETFLYNDVEIKRII